MSEPDPNIIGHDPAADRTIAELVGEIQRLEALLAQRTKERDKAERQTLVERELQCAYKRQRDQARQERDVAEQKFAQLMKQWGDDLKFHNGEYAKLNTYITTLREAVRKYGRHLDTCGVHMKSSGGLGGIDWRNEKMPCSCGLDQAMREKPRR